MLRRWWRALRGRPGGPAEQVADEQGPARPGAAADDDDPARRAPAPRRHTAGPVDDDPRREAHLGAVLQALAAGPLSRAELGRRVGADDWGPGRLDAVVDHGVATRVLVASDGGGDGAEGDGGATVRARYTD